MSEPEEIDQATALNFLHGATIEDASFIEDEDSVLAIQRGSILRLQLTGGRPVIRIRGDAELTLEVESGS